jgi:hypothetical protein
LSLVELEVLPDMNGTWSVRLEDVTTIANKLAGSGMVSLSNGRNIPFAVTGSYASRTDQSRFILKGTGLDLGANLNLTANSTATGLLLQTYRGRMLGQTVKPPPPLPKATTTTSTGSDAIMLIGPAPIVAPEVP